jgi:hypothetical protein
VTHSASPSAVRLNAWAFISAISSSFAENGLIAEVKSSQGQGGCPPSRNR